MCLGDDGRVSWLFAVKAEALIPKPLNRTPCPGPLNPETLMVLGVHFARPPPAASPNPRCRTKPPRRRPEDNVW